MPNLSEQNQKNNFAIDRIEPEVIDSSTLERDDTALNSVEVEDIEANNVEVNEVKLDDVEPSDVELVEIKPIDVELNNIESSDAEVNEVKLDDVALITTESDDVTLTDAELEDAKPIDAELENFEPNDVKLNTVKSTDLQTDESESNDVESNSIKLDSTTLSSVERVTNEAPVSMSSIDLAHNSKPMDLMPAHVTTGSSLTPKGRLQKASKITANGSRAFVWYLLALVVLIIDQWTKWLAETNLTFNEPVAVIEPFLNWTLAYNYGAAFSFLADAGGWQKWFFSGLALVIAIFLTIYLTRAPRQAKLLSLGLALVLGGAVGNLIDRLLHGHVIDFIHVHYANVWHYPIFNIADMAICIGVVMIIIDMIFLESKRDS